MSFYRVYVSNLQTVTHIFNFAISTFVLFVLDWGDCPLRFHNAELHLTVRILEEPKNKRKKKAKKYLKIESPPFVGLPSLCLPVSSSLDFLTLCRPDVGDSPLELLHSQTWLSTLSRGAMTILHTPAIIWMSSCRNKHTEIWHTAHVHKSCSLMGKSSSSYF